MGAANEKQQKETVADKPHKESIRRRIKESLKRRKPRALCTSVGLEFSNENLQQRMGGESTHAHYSQSSLVSSQHLQLEKMNVLELIQSYWALADADLHTADLTPSEVQQLKDTPVGSESDLHNCYQFLFKFKQWLSQVQNNPLLGSVLNLLKPFRLPIGLYQEDVLDEFLTSQFQLGLVSEREPRQDDMAEDCISYLLETDELLAAQIMLELRWVIINQAFLDQSLKQAHPLIQTVFSFQQVVLNHCRLCKLVLDSVKSVPLTVKLYTLLWNSFVRSIQSLDPLVAGYLHDLDQCYAFFYHKPKHSPAFDTHFVMAKLWAQTLNVKKYHLHLQDHSLALTPNTYFAFCDIWFNHHSVFWIGHSDANYPKEFLLLNEVLIARIHKSFLNIFSTKDLLEHYLHQSDQLKKLVGDVYYQLFFQKPMDDCLIENLKIALSSTVIQLSQQIEKGSSEQPEIKILKEEEEEVKEQPDIKILKEEEEEVKESQIGSQILFKSEVLGGQQVSSKRLLEDIITSILIVKLDDKQVASQISMGSSLSTQLASQMSSQYQQKNKVGQLIRAELEKVNQELCTFIDNVEEGQIRRMREMQSRNCQIEVRNQQHKVEFELEEDCQIFFNFQQKISFDQLFQFTKQKSLNLSDYLQEEVEQSKKESSQFTKIKVQQNSVDQNLAYHINKNHFQQ